MGEVYELCEYFNTVFGIFEVIDPGDVNGIRIAIDDEPKERDGLL
jgi:hypothetical protein